LKSRGGKDTREEEGRLKRRGGKDSRKEEGKIAEKKRQGYKRRGRKD
jgi:hypothetical protein